MAKAFVKSTDMSEEMQQEAVECAVKAMDISPVEKDVASCMKKEFDQKFGPTWHCIVGKHFGRYVGCFQVSLTYLV